MKKLLGLAGAMALATQAQASLMVDTILYGDPRTGNPSGIELSVEGILDAGDASIMDFTVDFTPVHNAVHGGGKLLEFYFNVNPGDAAQWDVFDVSAGYNVLTPATVQGGGNNIGFLFELDNQPPNTDGVPLEFSLQYLGGDLTADSFNLASDWESNDASLTEGQLGAHIGDLAVNDVTCPQGGCSDSGFAVGDWGVSEGEPDPQDIDAPSNLALLGLGLVGLYMSRRVKR